MQKFMENFYDYPIARNQADITSLLNDDFTRAVAYQTPDLIFDGVQVSDNKNFNGLEEFWRDKNAPKGERKDPGNTVYTMETLTGDSIQKEARDAGLIIEPESAESLKATMHCAAKSFSDVTRDYLGRDDFYMRIWQMWAPKGVLGRTPFLHIDRTYLTGLWYADRATAKIYTGNVPEKVWTALSPQRKNEHQNDDVLRKFSKNAVSRDFIDMPTGHLIVTKNSKAKNLSDESARRSVCIHSSGDVSKLGQVGIVMVPKFQS